MSYNSSSSIRRRGPGITSTDQTYPNYLPFQDLSESHLDLELLADRRFSQSNKSVQSHYSSVRSNSFISTAAANAASRFDQDDEEDVKTDVLYPRFSENTKNQGHVDMSAFNRMVKDHNRKLSMGSLQLSRTLSKQNQLYGSSKYGDLAPTGVRFKIYTSEKNEHGTTDLEQLLTDQGRLAMEAIVKTKGWWVDVLSPSVDEMRIISKTFHIHPLTSEDIQAQEPREKVEVFPNYIFVCFRAFDIDPVTDQIVPFNFYTLIFEQGFLTFHFKRSDHCDNVQERADQLKEYMSITPEWMNYALIDSVTDSFAPIILQVEMEAVSIDELSLVLKESEQADMLKRISRCRKKSTQLSRLLSSKLDVVKSLMKRYGDKSRELAVIEQQQQLIAPIGGIATTGPLKTAVHTDSDMSKSTFVSVTEEKKAYTDVLLYLGDIQDHVVTMVQNVNHYDRILHRAHTNYLAQVNLELTQTYIMTNNVMNRLTFLATVFIPLTLIGGLWGMNVKVPGKDYHDSSFFFWILGGMALYCTGCFLFGKRVGLL